MECTSKQQKQDKSCPQTNRRQELTPEECPLTSTGCPHALLKLLCFRCISPFVKLATEPISLSVSQSYIIEVPPNFIFLGVGVEWFCCLGILFCFRRLFFKSLFLFYIYALTAWMCMPYMHAWCPWRPEDRIGFP